MRIVYTLNDQRKAHILSKFLVSEGIENQLEITTNTDWGSANYGDVVCRLWVYDEDQIPAAMRWIEKFDENPEDPIFTESSTKPPPLEYPKKVDVPPKSIRKDNFLSVKQTGKITFSLLVLCTLLFIITELTTPFIPSTYPAYLPPTPLFTSPVRKAMLYDYPKAFEIVDKLVNLYGIAKLENPQELPPEGQYLLGQFNKTPYWQGIYDLVAKYFQDSSKPISINAPLFEKIREGEVWRLVTPCVLHSDILHILFNMLWLIVLGKQMEERLSSARYISFMVITGIFSNTCQYFMSGANFIGFSGILCAMIGFIWMRQRITPWEGYPLQKSAIAFVFFFILALFAVQVFSFYLEIHKQISFSPGIANTAHLSGALIGAILGRFSFFAWKT